VVSAAVLGAVVAVGAAVHSTWSPCGVSMLSTITPVGERGRNHRYGWTAGWFVTGAALGGLSLGALAAVAAWAAGTIGMGARATLAVVAAGALVTALSDLRIVGGRQLPFHRRQVNEQWLDRYRAWVYGGGFGWQIGFGLATYITTAAVYLTVLLAVLTGRPAQAMALGALYGLIRGLAVLLGRRLDTPVRQAAFHRRFEAAGPSARRAVIGLQLAVAAVAGLGWWRPDSPAVMAGAGVAGAVAAVLAVAAREPARLVDDPRRGLSKIDLLFAACYAPMKRIRKVYRRAERGRTVA
jgi:MFS family permease